MILKKCNECLQELPEHLVDDLVISTEEEPLRLCAICVMKELDKRDIPRTSLNIKVMKKLCEEERAFLCRRRYRQIKKTNKN
jgi:hypothetical protein